MTTSDSGFRIYVRDRPNSDGDMFLIGEIDKYITFECTPRHNAKGAWRLVISPGDYQANLIQPGRGIVVYAANEPLWPAFTGPITQITTTWSIEDGATVVVTGPCDNNIFGERKPRIDPDRELKYEGEGTEAAAKAFWDPEVIDFIDNSHYTYRAPNNTGEWIWSLLTYNYTNFWFSGDSDESRLMKSLKIAPQLPPEILALPNDTAWQGFPINMNDLDTVLFQAAEAAGLVLRVMWQPKTRSTETTNPGTNGLFLNISPISDRSNDVVFGPAQGNLSSYTLTSVAPDATRVFIEAETTTNDRRWLGYRKNMLFNPAGWISWDSRNSLGEHYLAGQWSDVDWGRQSIEVDWNTTAETFVDARDIPWPYQPDPGGGLHWAEQPHVGSDVAAQVDQAVLTTLVEQGPKGLFTMEVIDTPQCRFGTHYGVSDVVRVLVDTSTIPSSMVEEDGVLRELVREVKISSSKEAVWKIEPTIGSADSSPTPYIYRELKKLRSKVEDTSSRTEGDQTADIRPFEPHLGIVNNSWITPAGVPDHTPWAINERPQVNQFYQVYVNVNGGPGDAGYPVTGKAEVQLELRQGNDGDWVPSPQSQIYFDSGHGNVWFHNSSIDTLNAVKYWRARFVANGIYSSWSNVLKVTASSGALNTGGTLTLTAPSPPSRHKYANIVVAGTDTTRGSLDLQANTGSGWSSVDSTPTYVGNTFSFPYYVTDPAGTVSLRVQSFSEESKITLVKTSNTITFTVIVP